jgi:TRAP transporter TAXI family solute receptor
MKKKNDGKLTVSLLALLSLGLILWIAGTSYQRSRIKTVLIAAGSPKGESFMILRALKEVVERNYPNLRIVVQESAGPSDSLARMARNEVQLASVPADSNPGSESAGVALLFQDNVQILVRKTAQIHEFGDLKGKRIAIAKTGAQWATFLFIVDQFGLHEGDFNYIGADEDTASMAFSSGDADAYFRLCALPNAAIKRFGATGKVDFLAIERGAGLHAIQPEYRQATIPQGTYGGDPVVPSMDVPTVSVGRLLVARQDVGNDVIRAITETLMIRRQELAAAVPDADALIRSLFAQTRRPDEQSGASTQLHPGAEEIYSHTRESFIASHGDLIAVVLGTAAFIWLWLFVLGYARGLKQKNRFSDYLNRATELIGESRGAAGERELEPVRAELMSMMIAAVRDLGGGKISDESFRTFQQLWQVAMDTCGGTTALSQPAVGTSAAVAPEAKQADGPLLKLARAMQAR